MRVRSRRSARGARVVAATLRTLLVAAAVCLAGCDAGPEPTVIRFWAMGAEGEAVTALLPEFERTHPGIRVHVQQLPWSAAHEKLLTAFAGDATPDVCQLGNTWIPEFAALKALEPLNERLAASPSIVAADYFAGIWDTNVVDGMLLAVPWYVDTRLIFYRRDLLLRAGFATPPSTWDEWTRMLTAVKAAGGPDRYGIALPSNEVEPLLALALQQDEPLLRDRGQWGNFRSAGFRRALAFYAGMFRQGFAPPLANADVSNIWNEFGRGYFSFYVSGPWNIGEFKRRLPAALQSAWMTAPLPGPDGPGASIAGGASLAVFRASRHKDAAWQLIEYLSQPPVQQRFNALTGDLPPRRSAWRVQSLDDDVYARAFRDQLERVKPAPKVPEWERIATEIRVIAERVAHGELGVDDAAAELDRRADRLLEKRRWMLSREGAS